MRKALQVKLYHFETKSVFLGLLLFNVLLLSCKEPKGSLDIQDQKPIENVIKNKLNQSDSDTIDLVQIKQDFDTLKWTELSNSEGYFLDLRYATNNNFTDSIIYPCGRCFIRPELADKLKEISGQIKRDKGFALKLFDCYRPRPAQQRLWDIVPNATYVAHPKKGSMHNRGLAVDLTLVNIQTGIEVDMGTDFDFFGREARHGYQDLPEQVLSNRRYLKTLMESYGFNSIKSEWWHYSLNGTGHQLSSWEWDCIN